MQKVILFLKRHLLEVVGFAGLALAALGLVLWRPAYIRTAMPVTLSPIVQKPLPATATVPLSTATALPDTPTPTNMATLTPTPVVVFPTKTTTPLLTPTDIRVMGLVWSSQGTSVNLRESPNGRVIVPLPNGLYVRILDEREEKGGLAWVRVLAMFPNGNPAGWVAEDLVIPVLYLPAENIMAANLETVSLHVTPGGRVTATLWQGSLMRVAETIRVDQRNWAHVFVPDHNGTDQLEGWVLESQLAAPTPTLTPWQP